MAGCIERKGLVHISDRSSSSYLLLLRRHDFGVFLLARSLKRVSPAQAAVAFAWTDHCLHGIHWNAGFPANLA